MNNMETMEEQEKWRGRTGHVMSRKRTERFRELVLEEVAAFPGRTIVEVLAALPVRLRTEYKGLTGTLNGTALALRVAEALRDLARLSLVHSSARAGAAKTWWPGAGREGGAA